MVKNVSTFQLFINRQTVKIQSLSLTAFEWLFNTSDTPYCYYYLIIIILYDFLFRCREKFPDKEKYFRFNTYGILKITQEEHHI